MRAGMSCLLFHSCYFCRRWPNVPTVDGLRLASKIRVPPTFDHVDVDVVESAPARLLKVGKLPVHSQRPCHRSISHEQTLDFLCTPLPLGEIDINEPTVQQEMQQGKEVEFVELESVFRKHKSSTNKPIQLPFAQDEETEICSSSTTSLEEVDTALQAAVDDYNCLLTMHSNASSSNGGSSGLRERASSIDAEMQQPLVGVGVAVAQSGSMTNLQVLSPTRSSNVAVRRLSRRSLPSLSYGRRVVEWIQSRQVTCRGRETFLVSGLDKVCFCHSSCAESILLCGWKPPRYLWYMLSGGACDVCQILLLLALHQVIAEEAACWCLGFLMSIPLRHVSHRYLVFGDFVGGYAKSLMRMYAGYSIIIVLSTVFNFVMGRLLQVSVLTLSIMTLLWTGVANYFILRFFWSIGGPASSTASVATSSSSSTATPSIS